MTFSTDSNINLTKIDLIIYSILFNINIRTNRIQDNDGIRYSRPQVKDLVDNAVIEVTNMYQHYPEVLENADFKNDVIQVLQELVDFNLIFLCGGSKEVTMDARCMPKDMIGTASKLLADKILNERSKG